MGFNLEVLPDAGWTRTYSYPRTASRMCLGEAYRLKHTVLYCTSTHCGVEKGSMLFFAPAVDLANGGGIDLGPRIGSIRGKVPKNGVR